MLVVSSDLDDAHETVTRRTLIPPTGSFQLAEQHRMFDNAAARGLAQHAFDRSALNEPPVVPDPAAEGVLAFAPAERGGLDQPWEGEAEWPAWPTLGSKAVTLIGLPSPDAQIDLDFDSAGLTVRLPVPSRSRWSCRPRSVTTSSTISRCATGSRARARPKHGPSQLCADDIRCCHRCVG